MWRGAAACSGRSRLDREVQVGRKRAAASAPTPRSLTGERLRLSRVRASDRASLVSCAVRVSLGFSYRSRHSRLGCVTLRCANLRRKYEK